MKKTSWGGVSKWYNKTVGKEGHYYHQSVILPQLLDLMALKDADSVLDVGCGQGVLGRKISRNIFYAGVDVSPELVKEARRMDSSGNHFYLVSDATKQIPVGDKKFTHIVFLLSIQNMKNMDKAISLSRPLLENHGSVYFILNHPYFRIPRHTGWGIDEIQQIQFRRVNRYMSHLEIPIEMEPSKATRSRLTWSYHVPLSEFSNMLYTNQLVIQQILEWNSEKVSYGKSRKMENLARREIPLFMCLLCKQAV